MKSNKKMKVQVAVCNSSRVHMIEASRILCDFVQSCFDVRDVCSDGVRLHSSATDDVGSLCHQCRLYSIPYRRIDNWNVRVSLKESGSAFGFWIA